MFESELEKIRSLNRYRNLLTLERGTSPLCKIDGREFINFSSNNYLGLAEDPRLSAAAAGVQSTHGMGAGSSRLLSGQSELHEKLEADLADFCGTQTALVFGSGYQSNTGVIPALVELGDLILSDELNHASMIDGCRLSRAEVAVYRHCDSQNLEDILKRQGKSFRRRLILTEGVFSMEGSISRLADLMQLAEQYDCLLYVDDAHGLGTQGPQGRGTVSAAGLQSNHPRLIQLGTFGKALGCFGAFIAGSGELRELCINRARTFIFSTALPAGICAAVLAALKILREEPTHLERLRKNCRVFHEHLKSTDCKHLAPVTSPIQPLWVGDETAAIELGEKLLQAGIFARPIRPPTVPAGQCRIRFSLMATHTPEQLVPLELARACGFHRLVPTPAGPITESA